MRAKLAFGDLVVDPDGPVPGAVGIIVEKRRTDCRVLYPRTGRSAWTCLEGLRRPAADRLEGTLEARIASLLTLLSAAELEFTSIAPDRHRLIAGHGPIEDRTIDRVREALGDRLHRYVIRPQGMRRIQTILEFTHPMEPSP